MSKKSEGKKKKGSVTNFLFITTQLAAIVWVSVSYSIAAYATIVLGEPYPVVDLSTQAIVTILGGGILKVVQNIWEHNNGAIFGTTISEDTNRLVEVTTLNGRDTNSVIDKPEEEIDVGLVNNDVDF